MAQNETQQNMYTPNPNLNMNQQRGPAYIQAQPVQIVPVQYQAPTPPPQQVVVIKETGRSPPKSDNCCYCRAPRQSACGCLDPGQYYCCFLIVGNYFLLSLKYLMTCLCIIRMCQRIGF